MSASVFADGGGVYIGPDGKLHVIPPWNPEAAVLLNSVLVAFSAVAAATTIAERGVRQQTLKAALENLTHQVRELGQLANIAGHAGA